MNLVKWLREMPANAPMCLSPVGSHVKELEELLELAATRRELNHE
jgi:hypothetical protein